MRYLQILVFAENSALDRAPWGAGGRRFKSSRPDQYLQGFAGFPRKPHLTNSAGTPGFPDGNAWRVLRRWSTDMSGGCEHPGSASVAISMLRAFQCAATPIPSPHAEQTREAIGANT